MYLFQLQPEDFPMPYRFHPIDQRSEDRYFASSSHESPWYENHRLSARDPTCGQTELPFWWGLCSAGKKKHECGNKPWKGCREMISVLLFPFSCPPQDREQRQPQSRKGIASWTWISGTGRTTQHSIWVRQLSAQETNEHLLIAFLD